MGEYFVLANAAKQQYINAGVFNENIKRSGLLLGAHGASIGLLLRTPSPQLPPHLLLSTWLGDLIVAAGDHVTSPAHQLFGSDAPADISASEFVETTFRDISYDTIDMLCTVDPTQAIRLVDRICQFQTISTTGLIRLGDTVLKLGTLILQAALTARLGNTWIDRYVDACQAEHRYSAYLRPFGALEQTHLQVVRERQTHLPKLPLVRTYHTDTDHDVLVVNPVQHQFLDARKFRIPGELSGLYDGFVMQATHDLFTGLWAGDPIIVVGHDAPSSIAGLSISASSNPTHNLYDLVRASFEDISEVALDLMDWSDRSDFFHAKLAHTRSHPVDLYFVSRTAFRGGYSHEKYQELVVRLKQRPHNEHPNQMQQIFHALTSDILNDQDATQPPVWSTSFADYDTLEHDLKLLDTSLQYDLDRAIFMERVDTDRGVLEIDWSEFAGLMDSYMTKQPVGLIAANIWQSLAELRPQERFNWGLFIQRQ
jgi:hypothetical protein